MRTLCVLVATLLLSGCVALDEPHPGAAPSLPLLVHASPSPSPVRLTVPAERVVPPVRPTARPDVVQPAPHLVVVGVPRGTSGGGDVQPARRTVRGVGSWYCGNGSRCTSGYDPGCLCAAAGPELRVGQWRGRYVTVLAAGKRVRVKLVDCNCGPNANLIDLYGSAFSRLAPLSQGVVKVSVTWR